MVKQYGGGRKTTARLFIPNSGANFIAVIVVNIWELNTSPSRAEHHTYISTTSIFEVVDERSRKPTLLLVLWPIRRGWRNRGGGEIDGAQFVNGEFIGGEKWKRDTIVRD